MLYRTLLKIGLLPPLLNILLVGIGLLLLKRFRKSGILCVLLGLGSLYFLSTPIVADRLLAAIEPTTVFAAGELDEGSNTAIVVLGAGHTEHRREFAAAWPNENAIARLDYAVRLHRLTQLPMLLSGGQPGDSAHIHAEVMANYLWQQYFLRPDWLELKSRTTAENAMFSVALLREAGIESVVLVTQAVHMRRARLLFEREGIQVIPAATEFAEGAPADIRGWLPSAKWLNQSAMVMHEALGLLWYQYVGRG